MITHGRGSSIITYGLNFITEFFLNKKIKSVEISLKKSSINIDMKKGVLCLTTLKTPTNKLDINMKKVVKCQVTLMIRDSQDIMTLIKG